MADIRFINESSLTSPSVASDKFLEKLHQVPDRMTDVILGSGMGLQVAVDFMVAGGAQAAFRGLAAAGAKVFSKKS